MRDFKIRVGSKLGLVRRVAYYCYYTYINRVRFGTVLCLWGKGNVLGESGFGIIDPVFGIIGPSLGNLGLA